MRALRRVFIALLVFGLTFIPLLPAEAASSDSLYVFDFKNATSVVQNQGATYPNLNMNLTGNWSSDSNGTNFTGNLTNQQSGGNAKPASGSTLSASATQSVGAAVVFKQTTGCESDSQNISQIGAFANATTQVKLQLSKCASNKMYPECRIAGSLTPSNTGAARGSLELVAGTTYRLECVKGPDAGTTAPLVMRTTNVATGQVTTNNFTIPDTGSLNSTAHVTAGNKYPLPSQSNNTDQYKGSISRVGYCRSASLSAAQTCLTSDVPAQSQPPVVPAQIATTITDGQTTRQAGETYAYGLTVANTGEVTATATTATATIPANLTVTDADGGVVSGQNITWNLGDVAGGASVPKQLTVTLAPGAEPGSSIVADVVITSAEPTACGVGSTCTAQDINTVYIPPTPDPAQLTTTITDSASSRTPGETYAYAVTVTNNGEQASQGATAQVIVPSLLTIVNAGDGVVDGQTVTWTIGDVAPGVAVNKTLVVTLSPAATAQEYIVAPVVVVANDPDSCTVTGSICSAQDTNTVYVAPTFTEWVNNTSVETNLTGWTGRYNAPTSSVSVARSSEAAQTGSWSIKTTGLASASNLNAGFTDASAWVPTTTQGVTYTASSWVKPMAAGQQIVLRVREWSGDSIVTDSRYTYTATSTNWQNISTQLTTKTNGGRIVFIVYANDLDANEYFYADGFSLTTPN